MTEPTASSPGPVGGKALKEQNRWQIWLVIAANSLFLYGIVQADAIRVAGLRAVFTDANNLLPVGFALVLSTVFNGVLSPESKARLVFLRWRHALPGHRAFTRYGPADPRIDMAALREARGSDFPEDPSDQNREWYRMYKSVEKETSVNQAHRDFLLMRDYAGLSALFIVFFGASGFYAIASRKIALVYFLLLIVQYAIVRQAAANYGISFVTDVLAQKSGAPPQSNRRRSRSSKTS